MKNEHKWYGLILTGLAVMLGGFIWDAYLHTTEHAHLVVQALFDPTNPLENPAHIAIAMGLMWTTITTLVGFTQNWLDEKDRRSWRAVSVPSALWLVMGAAGIVSLMVLGQTP